RPIALALWDTGLGLSLNQVEHRIRCGASSVLRWLRARREGSDALRVRFSPGRPAKLGQNQRLVKLLLQGSIARLPHQYLDNGRRFGTASGAVFACYRARETPVREWFD